MALEGQENVYYGLPNPLQENCVDVDICPDLALAAISALGAAALLSMYLAATQNANGKRKKRRSTLEGSAPPLLWLVIHRGM